MFLNLPMLLSLELSHSLAMCMVSAIEHDIEVS